MAKRWKPNETSYLKRYARKRRVAELAKRFDTDDATVRAKLDELGLEAADHLQTSAEPDPGIAKLGAGVKALHGKKYAQAEKLLGQAEADAAQAEVANLARRYQAVARRRRLAKSEQPPADAYLEAVYERNEGNLEAALEICSRGGRQSKDERFAHLAASIHALQGDLEKAAKFLELAIEMNPRNRVLAYNDSDFAKLRASPEYAYLFAAGD